MRAEMVWGVGIRRPKALKFQGFGFRAQDDDVLPNPPPRPKKKK